MKCGEVLSKINGIAYENRKEGPYMEWIRKDEQSYNVVLGFGFQAINRKQRGAVAFEVVSLDTLVKFKGLVEDISGVIIPN